MKATKGQCLLYEDLILEILLRLPVKSLSRFKSVCQRWNTTIRSPGFINNHFHRESDSTGLLVYWEGYVFSPGLDHDEDFENFEKRDKMYAFSLFPYETWERRELANQRELLGTVSGMQGPCYGIFCVLSSDKSLALWNPATRRLRPVPPFPLQGLSIRNFGFGIDPLTYDLKIVVIDEFCKKPHFAIYNLSDNAWRSFEEKALVDPGALVVDNYFAPAFSNGFCYWMKRKSRAPHNFVLLTFDMHNESFQEIIPDIILESSLEQELIWYGDSPAVLTYNLDVVEQHFDLWLVKEQGRWTKLLTFSQPRSGLFEPIGVWKGNQIIAVTSDVAGISDWKLVVYDIDAGNTRNLEFRGEEYAYNRVLFPFRYKESLVSL